MADETSATADEAEVQDTSATEDTSTDGEALEDIEISPDEIGDDSKEEVEEASETDTEEDTSEEDDGSDKTLEDKAEEDTTPDKDEIAHQAFQQREAKRQREKAEAQKQYVSEADTDEQIALRQLQVDAYNNKVEFNQNKLQNGIDKSVAAIELFRTGTKAQKEALADSLDDFERMYVRKDQNGDPIEVTGDVYQHLQRKAGEILRLTQDGARKQDRDKSNTKSRTITSPASKPKKPKSDPDLDAFNEEAYGKAGE